MDLCIRPESKKMKDQEVDANTEEKERVVTMVRL